MSKKVFYSLLVEIDNESVSYGEYATLEQAKKMAVSNDEITHYQVYKNGVDLVFEH